MNKNWLIRTRHNQILGPISKEKVLEFVEKGSLVPDDELSMGNGYWFSIKEKALLDKYLYGDLQQEFNPISEAPNVLTGENEGGNTASFKPRTNPLADVPRKSSSKDEHEEELIPSDSDLEYPDMGDMFGEDDVTKVGNLPNITELNTIEPKPVAAKLPTGPLPVTIELAEDEEATLPNSGDLEYPDMGNLEKSEEEDDDVTGEFVIENMTPDLDEPIDTAGLEPKESKDASSNRIDLNKAEKLEEVSSESVVKTKKNKASKHRNDGILFFALSIVLFSILFGVYYYYSKILKKTFSSISIESSLISSVNAQAVKTDSFIKKKNI